ncbi:unnamed protein product [Medioppia subpectinata]|uniref:Uncharacterized protein n=1 Tax=Medioppia subpectinata TaxID=1979941 RepID=A0A7R9L6H8_9ACAR|nr:unnamed protein product [Medioppia subpectinata]CAG2116259.1 unnamed protein product [Medioppia subpectinata]
MALHSAVKGKLIAVIGDEEFSLHIDIILINQNVAELIRHAIDAHTAPVPSILEIPSKDHPYDPNKDSILQDNAHTAPVPSILEIPSKDHPYDPNKDSILRRAKGLFGADDR